MKKIFLFMIIIQIIFGYKQITYAKIIDDYVLLEPLPCISGGNTPCSDNKPITEISFQGFVGYAYRFLIAVAVFFTIVMITVGGFEYMFSESFTKKSAAKDRIRNAAYGLAGVLISYIVLNTIDPRLVQTGIDIPPVTIPTAESQAFREQIDSGFDNLTSEDLRYVSKKTAEKSDVEKRMVDLALLMENTQDPVEYAQYQAEFNKLKQDVGEIGSDISKHLYHALIVEKYRDAISAIDNLSDNYFGLGTIFTKNGDINDILKSIEDSYSQVSSKLTTNDKLALEKEKKFYTSQIIEELNMMSLVAKYEKFPSIPGYIPQIPGVEKKLNDLLNKYSAPKNKQPTFGSKELDDIYASITAGRISILKSTLKK